LKTTISVTDLSTEGYGIGRTDSSRVVAVPGTLPGDRVQVEFFETSKGLVRGSLLSLIGASPDRCDHPCQHYGEGCLASPLGAYSYQSALEWKRKNLGETLRRLGGIDIEVPPVIASPLQWGYRERVELGIEIRDNQWLIGYQFDNKIVPILDCQLTEEAVRKAVSSFIERFANEPVKDRKDSSGEVARILFRSNGRDGVVAVLFLNVEYEPRIDKLAEALTSLNLNGWEIRSVESLKQRAYNSQWARSMGETTVAIRHGGATANASALTFSQVNRQAAALLEAEVMKFITKGNNVLDLYGGWGMFGLSAAGQGAAVEVVDSNEDSLLAGESLARATGLNVRYQWGNLDQAAAWSELPREADVIILDPPRKGLSSPARFWLEKYGANRLIYISCHPAALARDLKQMPTYRLQGVQAFDMFPQTPDLETVAILERVR